MSNFPWRESRISHYLKHFVSLSLKKSFHNFRVSKSIDTIYGAQKRWSTNFKALKLEKGRSGGSGHCSQNLSYWNYNKCKLEICLKWLNLVSITCLDLSRRFFPKSSPLPVFPNRTFINFWAQKRIVRRSSLDVFWGSKIVKPLVGLVLYQKPPPIIKYILKNGHKESKNKGMWPKLE